MDNCQSSTFLTGVKTPYTNISHPFFIMVHREPNTTQAAIVQETVSGVTTRPLLPGDPVRMQLANVLLSPKGGGNMYVLLFHLFTYG